MRENCNQSEGCRVYKMYTNNKKERRLVLFENKFSMIENKYERKSKQYQDCTIICYYDGNVDLDRYPLNKW